MADIRAFFSQKPKKKGGKKKQPEVIDVDSDDGDFVDSKTEISARDFFSQRPASKRAKKGKDKPTAKAQRSMIIEDDDEDEVVAVPDDNDDDIDEAEALAVLMGDDDDNGGGDDDDDAIGNGSGSGDEKGAKQTKKSKQDEKTVKKENKSATASPVKTRRSPRKKAAAAAAAKPKREVIEDDDSSGDGGHDSTNKAVQGGPSKTSPKKSKGSTREKGRASVDTKTKATPKTAPPRAVIEDDDDDDDDDDGGFVPAALKKKKAKTTSPKKSATSTSKTAATSASSASSSASAASASAGGGSTETTPKKGSNFWAYKQRMQNLAPPNLGQKPLPSGAQNCLGGLKFVLTGVLDSIERDTAERLIKDHGGAVQKSVSGRVNYIVAGIEPGPSKMKKAEELKLNVIDEDGLFDLIRTLPEKPFDDITTGGKKGGKKATATKKSATTSAALKASSSSSSSAAGAKRATATASSPPPQSAVGDLWTVKYAPKSMEKIVGQSGARSNAKKLKAWLESWHQHLPRKNNKPTKNDTGFDKRCALLVGPPGIGKTTTAKLVCEACGYEPIELNASDARSKKLLEAQIGPLTRNCTMTQFYGTATKPRATKVAVIFDEVDGMAGNEDRGGVGEIMKLIKTTKMPIICIANDVPQKLRRLRDVSFHLPFRKLQTKQIRSAMMSVAFKEGLSLNPIVLDRIIEGANGDIRQILNNMYMWSRDNANFVERQDIIDRDIKNATKYTKKTPWDCLPLFFRAAQRPRGYELQEAFFQDYSAMPLFMQENYLRCAPHGKSGPVDVLSTIADAADAISEAELVGNFMMANSAFSALPVYGYMSCIRPGFIMRGSLHGRIEFSSWFGNNSKRTKSRRQCSELQQHMRKDISADTTDMRLSYVPYLRAQIMQPLIEQGADGAKDAVAVMNAYNLTRADWDSLHELSQLSGLPDPTKRLDTKTKTAFTRAYNSSAHMLPYAEEAASKRKKKQKAPDTEEMFKMEEDEGGSNDGDEDDEDDEDVSGDAMIKQKKKRGGGGGKAAAASKKRSGAKKKTASKGASKKKAKRG
ncbi:hypothetical protein PTSG_03969 [Salpingoeca rosetta]|uniref:Replication factor C subunit 1 n=1 Tax=Salpingoeca rosetta (strain ATCC 50818 / BSB-021) TaxID=946362 RepID=F2U7E3_SALR5|nr:uncharacterized protein PTSG_03969 [Salpingoeca rosetta]EGD83360.1 hypothetical protein PTSG_03969 [Salpingoeca rosetta]|eukprot:XP_004994864.1 hypothetical protein PTSG_03969 [Salpingoeca rosetta]